MLPTLKRVYTQTLKNRTILNYQYFRTKININPQIKSINLAKIIAIYPLLWYNYRGRIRILYKLSLRRLEGCLPLGQTLGLRTFATAKVRARARSNRGGVVSSVAVLRRCLWSKAEWWVSWRSYGFFGKIRQSRINRGVVLCFRFNYGKVVIIVAVLHHKVVASLRLD